MPIGRASETGPDRQNGFAPPICRTTNLAAADTVAEGLRDGILQMYIRPPPRHPAFFGGLPPPRPSGWGAAAARLRVHVPDSRSIEYRY